MKAIYKKSVPVLMLLVVGGCSEGYGDHQEKMNSLDSEATVVTQTQQLQQLSPDDVLLKYLDAGLKAGVSGKSKETYRLISRKDKDATPEDEYLSNARSGDIGISQEMLSVLMQKISYKIKSSVAEGANATIEVEMSVPRIPDALRKAMLKNSNPELEGKVISYLQSQNLQFDKSTETFELVKEQEGWRVFLDFSTSKKLSALVEEAEKLAPSMEMLSPIDGSDLESMKSNLLAAEKMYKEALVLGESFRATNNLEYLEKQIRKLRFYEQHKGQVQIKNVHVGEGRYGGKGVFGEVKNNSGVALAKVGVTIYFLDKTGSPVHEKSFHPVYVTERSYGDDAIPLKPNYSRKFGIKADDAPYDWSEKVEVVLSDIEAE